MATYAELGTSTFHSIPPPNLATVTRKDMLDYLENTWGIEETLFSGLKSEESFMMTANPLRRPLIFYFAHTAVSYVNKMLLAGICPERINPAYESLFAVGVDEMSWDDADLNTNCNWPSVSEVRLYREKVYNMVRDTINTIDYKLPVTWDDPMWSLFMALEHHRIHIETSSVLMHELPVDKVVRPKAWIDAPTFGEPPQNEFIEVSEGVVRYGKDRKFPSYGWDNEYGFKEVKVPSFSATKYLITNKDFLEFMKAGGYENESYWTTEGWRWCRSLKGNNYPHFWVPEGDGYKYRAMWDIRDMPWDWPAEVNFHEAKAYCNWKGPEYRVITEAEWHRIRDVTNAEGVEKDVVYSGIEKKANIQLVYGSSSPVNMFPPTESGFYDVHGNVWEWGEDFFYGLPGFQTHELYDDFSTPCFDSEHNMMFGGSWIATGDEASIYARFAFRRHFFQHLGFRLVKSTNPLPANSESARPNPTYETDKVVAQYMLFHYGPQEANLPFSFGPKEALDFPVRIAQECLRVTKGHTINRAMDLGCSVGRSVFEMAKEYEMVLGIDFSARFISCGCRLKENGSLEYSVLEEGERQVKEVAIIDASIDRSKVEFKQGDACNLPHFIGTFDLILMSNLIDRLATPMACLQRLPSLVNPGGFVVIASPYTWLEEFTPRANWLGGEGGEGTLEALTGIMESNGFALLEVKELPFFMREHKRKYQWAVSQMTAWQKK